MRGWAWIEAVRRRRQKVGCVCSAECRASRGMISCGFKGGIALQGTGIISPACHYQRFRKHRRAPRPKARSQPSSSSSKGPASPHQHQRQPTLLHTTSMARRRRPPRPGALADLSPSRILKQMALLQFFYYGVAIVLIVFTTFVAGRHPDTKAILDWRELRGDVTTGWTLALCWLLGSLITYVQ